MRWAVMSVVQRANTTKKNRLLSLTVLALVWAEIAISEMVVSVGERDVLKVVETFAFAKGEIVVLVEELAFPLLSICKIFRMIHSRTRILLYSQYWS